MVSNALSEHSRQFDSIALSGRNKHEISLGIKPNQNFISTSKLFSGYILVIVIVMCRNFSLKTVRHIAILFTKELNYVTLYYFIETCTPSQLFFNAYKNSIKLLYKINILEECSRN